MKVRSLFLSLLLITPVFLAAQFNWQQTESVEDVCKAYPEKMQYIFQNLNLDYPGLQQVKASYEKNDLAQACEKLLDYYAKSNRIRTDLPAVTSQTITAADSVLQDIYTFQNVSGQVPRLADGRLKWAHNGPENDIEWAWALNRHYPTHNLLDAWEKTGNPKYIEYIDQFTKDWIISSWPYPEKKSSTAMWRGLEVSFRAKTWALVFYDLWNTRLISPATRLLILSSLPDHAHYARNFHAQGNWLTMEISGLATVASSWPEFKESKAWMDYAIQTMVASMKDQVYLEGVQTELTSSYHFVALANFKLFADICQKNNVPLPEYFTKTLEDMYNYLALTIRPDGFGLLNNDADLIDNRERLLKAASEYNRKEWEYIVTNGKSGIKPDSGPSYVFPYAGQLLSRSGFDVDAQWSFFDIGPWGSGHQHNDKLHISVAAYGRDLLVDGGRFAYRGAVAEKFRKYATGSASHNVLLIDGKGQGPGPLLAKEPLSEKYFRITSEYDFAWNSFDKFMGLEGECRHTRSMFYARGDMWIVVDQIATDRPRKIQALWHFHPDCKVIHTGNIVKTENDRGNLQIIPVEKNDWEIQLVKGQEEPEIQGWYSEEYNKFEPNVAAVYSTQIDGDATFVWVLFPSEKLVSGITATVLSKNEKELKVKVTNSQNDEWIVSVPIP